MSYVHYVNWNLDLTVLVPLGTRHLLPQAYCCHMANNASSLVVSLVMESLFLATDGHLFWLLVSVHSWLELL